MGTDSANTMEEAARDLRMGDVERAVKKYRQAIQFDPDNARAYQGLAQSLNRLRREPEAIEACRRSLELNPNLAIPHAIVGSIYGRQHKYEEAKKELEKARELDPNLIETYISLGAILDLSGELQEAETSLRRAIDLDPGSSSAYYNLSLIYSRQGFYDKAANMAQTAFRLKPSINVAVTLTLEYMAKYPVAVSLLVGLFYVASLSTRSFVTLPLMATLIAFFLGGARNAVRSKESSRAIIFLLTGLFLVCVYIYNMLAGPLFSLPLSIP